MNLEDALNLELPDYRVELVASDGEPVYRAQLPDYPQCTGLGNTPADAVRGARHLLIQLRDGQAAVAVCDMRDETAERLKDAMRTVVARAFV